MKTIYAQAKWRMLIATMFCYLFYYTGRQTLGFAIPFIEEDLGLNKKQLGVIGTALTQNFMDRREREKMRAQAAVERKETIKSVSELLAANQLQAELLVEAVEAGEAPDEVEQRKDEYEQAYKTWRTQRTGLTLLARELMTEEQFVPFDEFVGRRLNDGTVVPLRQCLLKIHRAWREGRTGPGAVDCEFDELSAASTECSDAVVEALYAFAATGASPSGKADDEVVQSVRAHVDEGCPGG